MTTLPALDVLVVTAVPVVVQGGLTLRGVVTACLHLPMMVTDSSELINCLFPLLLRGRATVGRQVYAAWDGHTLGILHKISS